jgi:hypothetical protein
MWLQSRGSGGSSRSRRTAAMVVPVVVDVGASLIHSTSDEQVDRFAEPAGAAIGHVSASARDPGCQVRIVARPSWPASIPTPSLHRWSGRARRGRGRVASGCERERKELLGLPVLVRQADGRSRPVAAVMPEQARSARCVPSLPAPGCPCGRTAAALDVGPLPRLGSGRSGAAPRPG